MPDVFVFPGGRVETEDQKLPIAGGVDPRVAKQLSHAGSERRVRALATAAIRETWEETGLTVGEIQDGQLRPDLSALSYLGRAITPSESRIRYHARFFAAPANCAHGQLTGNGELIDLRWVGIEEALALPIIDVTEALLEHIRSIHSGEQRGALFIHYRRGVQMVREETTVPSQPRPTPSSRARTGRPPFAPER